MIKANLYFSGVIDGEVKWTTDRDKAVPFNHDKALKFIKEESGFSISAIGSLLGIKRQYINDRKSTKRLFEFYEDVSKELDIDLIKILESGLWIKSYQKKKENKVKRG